KVKATVALGDGSFLYTHDGPTRVQTIGVDNFRDYYTAPNTELDVGPADIDEKRQWVLDLVFNPEGIVKGFSGDGTTRSNIREQTEAGPTLRGINVPM